MNKKSTLLLVPLIMIFFFARNIYLVENENMDSWMGGGMRMFGEIDKMLYRVAGFNVEYNDKKHFVNLKTIPQLDDEDVEIKILPSSKRLKEVLNTIKAKEWYFDAETNTIKIGKSKNELYNINNSSIKNIQVYRIQFNHTSKEVSLELINEVNHE